MASRRVAKTAVDWAAFAERVPANQRDFFRAFKAKSENFVNRVHQYPENLPKIDFAFYKSRLAAPALADQFEKQYASVTVPYPTDKNNLKKSVEEEQKTAEKTTQNYISQMQEQMKDAKLVLSKLDGLPPPNEMTMEMYAYYFPENMIDPVNRPTFWPHTPNLQPGDKDCANIK